GGSGRRLREAAVPGRGLAPAGQFTGSGTGRSVVDLNGAVGEHVQVDGDQAECGLLLHAGSEVTVPAGEGGAAAQADETGRDYCGQGELGCSTHGSPLTGMGPVSGSASPHQ